MGFVSSVYIYIYIFVCMLTNTYVHTKRKLALSHRCIALCTQIEVVTKTQIVLHFVTCS